MLKMASLQSSLQFQTKSIPRILCIVLLLVVSSKAQETLACPLRQIGLDYAQVLQPWYVPRLGLFFPTLLLSV